MVLTGLRPRVNGAILRNWLRAKDVQSYKRPAAHANVGNENHANRQNNQRVHKIRKGPSNRPWFIVSKSATVFLVDII
jgi:hypothetical protein